VHIGQRKSLRNDGASLTYVGSYVKDLWRRGVNLPSCKSCQQTFPKQELLNKASGKLKSKWKTIDGLLVQLPLPEQSIPSAFAGSGSRKDGRISSYQLKDASGYEYLYQQLLLEFWKLLDTTIKVETKERPTVVIGTVAILWQALWVFLMGRKAGRAA